MRKNINISIDRLKQLVKQNSDDTFTRGIIPQVYAAEETGLLKESEIHQEGDDEHQAVSDSGLDVNIFKIDPLGLNTHFNLSRNKTANTNDIIAKPRLIVNSRSLRTFDPFSELGIITRTPIQPAAKLMSRSEPTENKINILGNTIIKNLRSSNLPPQAYAAGREKRMSFSRRVE